MRKILIFFILLFLSAFFITSVRAEYLDPNDRSISWGCEYKEGSDECTTFDPVEVSFKNVYENPSIDESIHYIGYTLSGNKIFEVYNPDKDKYTSETFSYEKNVDNGDSFKTKVRFPITEDGLKECVQSGKKQCEYNANVAVQVKYCNIEVEPKDCYWHSGAEIKLKGVVDVKQPEPLEIKIVKQEMRYWDSKYDPIFDWTLQVNRKPTDTPWNMTIDTSCNGHTDNHGGNFAWSGVEISDSLELNFGNGVYREYIKNPQDSVKFTIKNNKGETIYSTNLTGPTCNSAPKEEPTPTPEPSPSPTPTLYSTPTPTPTENEEDSGDANSSEETTNIGGVVTSNNSNNSDSSNNSDESDDNQKDNNVFESSNEYSEKIANQEEEKKNTPSTNVFSNTAKKLGSIFGTKDKKEQLESKAEVVEQEETNTDENDLVQNQDNYEFNEIQQEKNTKRFAIFASLITFVTAAGASVYYFFGETIAELISNIKA